MRIADFRYWGGNAAALSSGLAYAHSRFLAYCSDRCGDAMSDPVNATQLFDITMDHIAGSLALVTHDGFWGIEGREAAETQGTTAPRYGRGGKADLGSNPSKG